MNALNERRSSQVADQLFSFTPNDATPTNNFTIDPEYTLVAHLPREIVGTIHAVSRELQSKFPGQYYYLPEQYHLTVVPIPRDIEPSHAIELLAPILSEWKLPITVRGLAVNRFQAAVVLYPENETLIPQRHKLRTALGITEQSYTIHRPVWEELLWANFMRFTAKPSEELLTFLRDRANMDFGHFVLSSYELYEVSTKTLDPASSTLLHTFNV